MHLRTLSKIVIVQKPTSSFPGRSKTFTFNFCHEFNVESSWACLTKKGTLKFPKNIVAVDEHGNKTYFGGDLGGRNNNTNNIMAPLGDNPPLFLKGDSISISSGYAYFDKGGNAKYVLNKIPGDYIVGVNNKMPIEILFEDNMYILKQTLAPDKTFVNCIMEDMLSKLIDLVNSVHGTNLTFSNPFGSKTSLGDFKIQKETVAQVLERLQKDYKIESFFKDTALTASLLVYTPNDTFTNAIPFVFQKNIISDSMNYQRTDDLKLALHAYSVDKEIQETITKSGRLSTKKKRLETTVTVINGKTVEITSTQLKDYSVRTMFFWADKGNPALTLSGLKKKATEALNRFYFEGYRGKFTTFLLPFVQTGDVVSIQDNRLPERFGKYFVKGVTYKGGMSGMRQEIEIDFRADAGNGVIPQSIQNFGI